MKRMPALRLGVLAISVASAAVATAQLKYEFKELDFNPPNPPAVWTSCYGINNRGDVCGAYGNADVAQDAFYYRSGVFTDVTFPNTLWSLLSGINDEGTGVGYLWDLSGDIHGFVRSKHGRIDILDVVPGEMNIPFGINNSGVIVGSYGTDIYISGNDSHGYILDRGRLTTVDYPGSGYTGIGAINDRGQMVGWFRDALGIDHGFLLQGRHFTAFDPPGSTWTVPNGINNRGDISGFFNDQNGTMHGFVLEDGVFTQIDFPGATDTGVVGINDSGQIVGAYDGWNCGFVATPKQGKCD